MSIWTEDLLELAIERWRAKHPSGTPSSRFLANAAKVVEAILTPFVALLFGILYAVILGGLFGLLWPPLGLFVGLLAFLRGCRDGARLGAEE